MKIYEAILEYIRLREYESPHSDTSRSHGSYSSKWTYATAHQIVDYLSDSELKQECSIDNATDLLRESLDEPADYLLPQLSDVEFSDREKLNRR